MTEASDACFICEKHRQGEVAPGGVLFRDDLVYAGHAFDPAGAASAYRGYLMVEPVRHVGGLGELSDDEAMRLGWLVNQLSRLQKSALGAEHVYAFVFGGAPPSQRAPAHLHVHLAPRYPGTPAEFRAVALTRWPDAPRVDRDQMRALIAQLRSLIPAAPSRDASSTLSAVGPAPYRDPDATERLNRLEAVVRAARGLLNGGAAAELKPALDALESD